VEIGANKVHLTYTWRQADMRTTALVVCRKLEVSDKTRFRCML